MPLPLPSTIGHAIFQLAMSDSSEPFDLYATEEYRVIGRATRGECHGNPALVHAVARVHVRDCEGRILLQLRSASKDIQPGRWDTSVGGHLLPGEEPEAAARREMMEELGVAPGTLVFLHRFLWRTAVESEWVTTYSTVHAGPFSPDPGEIADLRFWTRAEIAAALGTGQFTPAFEDEFRRLSPPHGGGPAFQ
jgi:isopentenyldiphosphate isomerase